MKIIFMGTPEFAVPSLNALVKSEHEVVAVVTVADKASGRGQKIHQSAIKEYALTQGIDILQPTNLKDAEFISELSAYQADLFVVIAFRMLPQVVWQMPSKGCVNLHGSLLPDYRGAAPINWAIIKGESKTGVTSFFIDEKIDTGDILLKSEIDILSEDTAGDLHDRMMNVAAELCIKTVDGLDQGILTPRSQKNSNSTKEAKKIFKEDCILDFNASAQDVHNKIRGLSPYPAALWNTELNGKLAFVKVYKSEIGEITNKAVGSIETDNKRELSIACKDKMIKILELQAPTKRRLGVKDFLNGNKF